MVIVGSAAPPFDCTAVVAGRLARLGWQQVQDHKTLVLLFDATGGPATASDDLIALGDVVARAGPPGARVVVVCHCDPDELLARANSPGGVAVPLVVDPAGRIASRYGLRPAGRRPLWGRFLIDPAGVVRQAAVSDFPLPAGVEELLRLIGACAAPADAGRGS